jgi:hypothetical protein
MSLSEVSVKDKDGGEARKQDGMARASAGASLVWLRAVEDAIHYVATQQRELTTDDVWERLSQGAPVTTREHRAMGPAMKAARAKGWIEITNSYIKTERKSRNRAPIQVWRSRIYRVRSRREQMT